MTNITAISLACLALSLATACSNGSLQQEAGQVAPVQALAGTSPPAVIDTFRYDLQYVMGKFEPAEHPDFVAVDPRYADQPGRYLHKDTYAAFVRMYEAALADSVRLTIISAARNFANQKAIWEAKWNGERRIEGGKNAAEAYPQPKTRALKILEYSSMPGSSRHHWGTDLDLIDLNNDYFDSGPGKRAYNWLRAHAAVYGFCQPYTAGRPSGYQEERWHWSYLPLAMPLTDLARRQLKDEMIQGFAGAATARDIGIVEKYVLGINLDCLPR